MPHELVPSHYLIMECGQGHDAYEVLFTKIDGRFFALTKDLFCEECVGDLMDCQLFQVSELRKVK